MPDIADVPFARVHGRDLLLDVYYPPERGEAPLPVVVVIHGGGFRSGDRRALASRARAFADAGFAAVAISYRLSGEAIWPAQAQDCRAAVRWVRARAADFGFDRTRVAAMGTSAGGHLAAWLGASGGVSTWPVGDATHDLEGAVGGNLDQSSAVQAVIDFFGPTDFSAMPGFPSRIVHEAADSPESLLVGAPILEVPERVASANPITYVRAAAAAGRALPPYFIAHGREDNAVPFNQSELLHEALLAAGAEVTFVDVARANHGDARFWRAGVQEAAIAWLRGVFAQSERKR